MKWFRCELVNDDGSISIWIDVLVNDLKVVEALPAFFGYWDDADEVRKEPFVLDYSGNMEWGSTHVSLFPIRGQRLIQGLEIDYVGYENKNRQAENDASYRTTFRLKSYRDYAG